MALVSLTPTETTNWTAGIATAGQRKLAEECRGIVEKVWRDAFATATHCQLILAAGKHPAIAADYALSQTGLATDVARFSTEALPAIRAACLAIHGTTNAQLNVILKVLNAAALRLTATAADGSTIAVDAADVLAMLACPPTIWS